MSTPPQPGWFPDPWQPGSLRYWDGSEWTGHVRATEPRKTNRRLLVGLVAGGVLLLLVLIALAVVAVVTTGDRTDADSYEGAERAVVATIDDFERALEDEEVGLVCGELFTDRWEAQVSAGADEGDCEDVLLDEVGGAMQQEIDVKEVRVTGPRATVRIEEGGTDETVTLVREAATWRIDRIDVHE